MDEPLLLCLDDLPLGRQRHGGRRAVVAEAFGRTAYRVVPQRPSRQGSRSWTRRWRARADGATKIVLDALSDEAIEQVVTDLLAAAPDEALRRSSSARGASFSGRTHPRPGEEQIVAVVSGRATLTEDRCRPGRAATCASDWRACRRSPNRGVAASSLGRRFTVADLAI